MFFYVTGFMFAGFLGFQAKQIDAEENAQKIEQKRLHTSHLVLWTGDRHSYRGDGGQQEAAWISLREIG